MSWFSALRMLRASGLCFASASFPAARRRSYICERLVGWGVGGWWWLVMVVVGGEVQWRIV